MTEPMPTPVPALPEIDFGPRESVRHGTTELTNWNEIEPRSGLSLHKEGQNNRQAARNKATKKAKHMREFLNQVRYEGRYGEYFCVFTFANWESAKATVSQVNGWHGERNIRWGLRENEDMHAYSRHTEHNGHRVWIALLRKGIDHPVNWTEPIPEGWEPPHPGDEQSPADFLDDGVD